MKWDIHFEKSPKHLGGFEVAGSLHHVEGDLHTGRWADPIGNAQALQDWIPARTVRPSLAPPPSSPPPSILTQIGGFKHDTGPPKEQHAGGAQALVHQGNSTLLTRVGNGLPHKGRVLMGTGQLD